MPKNFEKFTEWLARQRAAYAIDMIETSDKESELTLKFFDILADKPVQQDNYDGQGGGYDRIAALAEKIAALSKTGDEVLKSLNDTREVIELQSEAIISFDKVYTVLAQAFFCAAASPGISQEAMELYAMNAGLMAEYAGRMTAQLPSLDNYKEFNEDTIAIVKSHMDDGIGDAMTELSSVFAASSAVRTRPLALEAVTSTTRAENQRIAAGKRGPRQG